MYIHYKERVLCDNEVVFQHYQCEINQENVETHIGHIPFDGATLCRNVMISHEESKTVAIRMKGQCHAYEG